jgi:hypothetical protein
MVGKQGVPYWIIEQFFAAGLSRSSDGGGEFPIGTLSGHT